MKKLLVICSLLAISKISIGQKVVVADTIKMQLTGPSNQPQLHKLIKYYMNDGWSVQSAERNETSNTYVWKLQKVVYSKRKKD